MFSSQPFYVILAFTLGFALSGLLTRMQAFLQDIPNERSSHTKATPRGGGLSLLLPFLICGLIFLYTQPHEDRYSYAFLLGSAIFALLGLWDDIRSLPISIRLSLQMLLALAICLYGAPDRIAIFGLIEFTGWPVRIIQVLWLMLCINFYNFMDGLDGLAALQAIFCSILLATLLNFYAQTLLADPNLTPELERIANYYTFLTIAFYSLSAASIGFLIWNIHPARLFMGDTGSYFLGFLFGFTALIIPFDTATHAPGVRLILTETNAEYCDLTTVTILLLPFFLDAAFTLFYRLRQGKNILRAHREHLYQLLHRNGFSANRVVLYYLLLNALLLPLVWLKLQDLQNFYIFFTLCGIITLLGIVYFQLARRYLRGLQDSNQ